jgi:hypothetical protein
MKNNKWKFHLPFLKKEVGGLSSPKCWCLIGKINLGETIDIDHLVQFVELWALLNKLQPRGNTDFFRNGN